MKLGLDRAKVDSLEGRDALTKKEVLVSIYREKLRFDGKKCRTPRLNEAVRLIYNINNNKVQENKNGKERDSKCLSRAVLSKIQISKHFIEDLEVLLRLIA